MDFSARSRAQRPVGRSRRRRLLPSASALLPGLQGLSGTPGAETRAGAGLAGTAAPPACPQRGGAGLVSLFLLCVLIDAPFADGRGTRAPVQVGNSVPSPPPRFGRSPPPALCPVSPWGPAVRVLGRHGHRAACSLHLVSTPQPSEPACSFRLLRSRVPHAGCLGGPIDTPLQHPPLQRPRARARRLGTRGPLCHATRAGRRAWRKPGVAGRGPPPPSRSVPAGAGGAAQCQTRRRTARGPRGRGEEAV